MTLLELASVSYFGSSVVGDLVRSLVEQTRDDWRLVIVDNSENRQEFESLRTAAGMDPRVVVAAAPSNLGYLGGAEWWRSRQPVTTTWLAVCNTDLYLDDRRFVERLAALGPEPAILAPDITAMPSRRRQNPYMTGRPTARRTLFRRLVLSYRPSAAAASFVARSKRGGPAQLQELSPREVYAPHGSFMLFPRTFFDRGGSLQHRPFLFAEEITIAERARALGIPVRFEPGLKVLHTEHQATGARTARIFRAQREAVIYAHKVITGRETLDGTWAATS